MLYSKEKNDINNTSGTLQQGRKFRLRIFSSDMSVMLKPSPSSNENDRHQFSNGVSLATAVPDDLRLSTSTILATFDESVENLTPEDRREYSDSSNIPSD